MEYKYINDLLHNYLVLEKSTDSNTYKYSMILNNSIKGILPVSTREMNNKTYLYYDVSGKQTLDTLIQKKTLNYEDLRKIFLSILSCIEEIKRFLLDANDILINTKLIYCTSDSGALEYCYYPDSGREFKQEFTQFLNYLITKVDHSDKRAVLLGYDIQSISIRDDYTLSVIMDRLMQVNDVHEKTPEIQVDNQYNLNTIYDDIKVSKVTYNNIIRIILLTILIIIITIFYFFYSRIIYNQFGFLIFIVLIGTVLLISYKNIFHGLNRLNDVKENEIDVYPENNQNTTLLSPLLEDTYPYLEFIGEKCIEPIILNTLPIIIGKLENRVNYVLIEPSVSRIHAKITQEDQEYFLEDLDSTNGTYVNDKRIESFHKTRIQQGDIIKFARLPFKFNQDTIN